MRYLLIILLFYSCGRKYEFSYSVITSEEARHPKEFQKNILYRAIDSMGIENRECLLESKINEESIFSTMYIYAAAGKGTNATLEPFVLLYNDTVYLSIKFSHSLFQFNESTDLANPIKLNFIIHDRRIKYLVFVQPENLIRFEKK